MSKFIYIFIIFLSFSFNQAKAEIDISKAIISNKNGNSTSIKYNMDFKKVNKKTLTYALNRQLDQIQYEDSYFDIDLGLYTGNIKINSPCNKVFSCAYTNEILYKSDIKIKIEDEKIEFLFSNIHYKSIIPIKNTMEGILKEYNIDILKTLIAQNGYIYP